MSTESTPPGTDSRVQHIQALAAAFPSRKRGGAAKRILIGVLGFVLVVGVGLVVRNVVFGGPSATEGECVGVKQQSGDKVDVENISCGDDKAVYKVGKVLDNTGGSCPEGGLYAEVTPAAGIGDGYKLCLMHNFVEGACYTPDDTGSEFTKGACGGPDTVKVAKVLAGSTDTADCPDGAGLAYPEPAVTFCLVPGEG